MSKRETPEEQEDRMRREYYQRREDRLSDTLTRREVIEAIESVAEFYAQERHHDADLMCVGFQRLADAMR